MTNYIFPSFQGFSWQKTLTPYWNTTIHEAESGLECRVQKWSYPRYKIELNYNFLTDNSLEGSSLVKGDIENLAAFFNSIGGAFQNFLYKDDVDNSVTMQSFGVGNGTKKEFQLVRSGTNWVEPVKGIVEPPTIYIDGEETAAFSFDNNGKIIFEEAPASGAILKWSGGYYFRCRFESDELEVTRSFKGIWEDITIKMVTVK